MRVGMLVVAWFAGVAVAGPSSVEVLRDLLGREMYRSLEPKLTAFLEREPESAGANAILAEFELARQRPDAAEAAARRAVDLDRENAERWLLWGRTRFEQGLAAARNGATREANRWRFEQAESGFRTAQQLDPNHVDVLWWIGRAKEYQGDRSLAWQFYDTEISEFPRYAAGYRCLGRLHAAHADAIAAESPKEAAKLRAEALATYDRGLDQAGADAELLWLRSRLLETLGEREGALDSLERSVRADPTFARAWDRLEEVLPGEKLVALAAEALSIRADAARPARIAGQAALGRAPAEGEGPYRHFEIALAHVLPALDVHGDDEALYRIAFPAAQALIGDTPKTAPNGSVAVDAFGRIHRAYAWSGDAANNLGFFFREIADYEESLAWYLRAVERAPENQDILNDTGLIYLFHFPAEKAKGLPYFLKTVALVEEGDQKPERGYWDALENLTKHYWEVDRQPEKVIEYARMRYETTKGVAPYNTSQVAAGYAAKARRALAK